MPEQPPKTRKPRTVTPAEYVIQSKQKDGSWIDWPLADAMGDTADCIAHLEKEGVPGTTYRIVAVRKTVTVQEETVKTRKLI